jgi:hypothetical protein
MKKLILQSLLAGVHNFPEALLIFSCARLYILVGDFFFAPSVRKNCIRRNTLKVVLNREISGVEQFHFPLRKEQKRFTEISD